MRVVFGPAIGCAWTARSQALDIGHIKCVTPGVVDKGAWKPADRNQTEQPGFARPKLENGHGVLRSVASEQSAARTIKGEGIGLSAEQIGWILAGADRLDDAIGSCVQDSK